MCNITTDWTSLIVDGDVGWRMIKVNLDLVASEVQIPIQDSHEQSSSNDITKGGWNHRVPDVVANRQLLWCSKEDSKRHKEHVRDNMVSSKSDEAHNRKPDGDDLGDDFACRYGQEDCHCDKPVSEDGFDEYLMPSWCDGFGDGKIDCFGRVVSTREDASVSDGDDREEEHSSKIAEERDEPCLEKVEESDASMEECNGREETVRCEEISTCKNAQNEADRKEAGS